jgi:chorismate mutase/prephenate dehydratase
MSSNAAAARRVRDEPDAAAIAGEVAAKLYEVNILRRNIEDATGNTTRFLVVGTATPPPSGNDVTSLMFTTPNRPGALQSVLSVLAAAEISMTRIESRPLREAAWDYVFFVDIDGHAQSPSVAAALKQLEDKTSRSKVLGSYPRAVM